MQVRQAGNLIKASAYLLCLTASQPLATASKLILLIASLMLLSQTVQAGSTKQVSIAIVIDDLGHHYQRGLQLIELPYPLTLAFLPKRKYTEQLAQYAFSSGKEVMLHAPMANMKKLDLGYGALTLKMTKTAMQSSLAASLESVPHAIGVNNHMGSALTQNPKAMAWIMEALATRPLYFLDSKTSAQSVAAHTAKQYGIPAVVRDVFLDHETSREFVERQFERLIEIASEKGSAIAIGHPHRVTIDFLNEALPTLGERGISLATISAIVSMHQARSESPLSLTHLPKPIEQPTLTLLSKSDQSDQVNVAAMQSKLR